MSSHIELLWGNVAKMRVGQQMKEHRHACFQLYYIISGTPVYIISGTQFSACPGSYFIVPEMAPHSILELTNSELVCYEFKLLIKDPALAQHFQTLRQPMTDSGVVKKLLRYVIKNWSSKTTETEDNIDCILTTVLMSFFVDQLNHKERDSRFITTHDYNKVTKDILLYIEQHYPEEFLSDRMAQSLNYNKNYLSSMFKKNTGYTIIDYLNMIRIRNAVIIFVYYGQDVFSTCECVGFKDISHFGRTFKAYTGVSPREFKKALADPNPAREAKRTLIDPILNFQVCSIEESFQSLRNIQKYCDQ